MNDHRTLMQELLLENAELHRTVYDARIGSDRDKKNDRAEREDDVQAGRK